MAKKIETDQYLYIFIFNYLPNVFKNFYETTLYFVLFSCVKEFLILNKKNQILKKKSQKKSKQKTKWICKFRPHQLNHFKLSYWLEGFYLFPKSLLPVFRKGQKLFPLADRYPKPLLPIANKPLIAYQLEHLEKMGFFEVLILHRHSKTLEKYLKSEYKGRMQIETVEINEDSTNNVEALKQIWNKITRDFIVIPCDLLTDVNFDDILDQHIITQASVTMVFRETPSTKPPAGKKEALKENKDESDDYDVVVLDDDTHRVLQITNNSDLEGEGLSIKKTMLLRHPKATISTQLYECHLYVFNYRMIDFLKNCKRKFSNIKDDLIPFLIQNQYNKKLDREFFTEEYLDEEQLEKPKNLKEPEKKKKHVSIFGYISRNTYCKRINVINEYIQGNLDSFLRPPALPNCLFSTNNNEKESTEKK